MLICETGYNYKLFTPNLQNKNSTSNNIMNSDYDLIRLSSENFETVHQHCLVNKWARGFLYYAVLYFYQWLKLQMRGWKGSVLTSGT